jgi:spore coat polysaccharide biosynthesis protein SpsF
MIIAVVQARMGSRRLPGKSLLPLMGEPLFIQVLRFTQELDVHKAVLATSNNPEDDLLEYWAQAYGIEVVRGEQAEDVLDRYLMVVERYDPQYIVRICGDSPCMDTKLTNQLIREAGKGSDYVGYEIDGEAAILSKQGIFAEVIRGDAMKKATTYDHEYYREHVTNVFYMSPEKFNLKLLPVPEGLKYQSFKTSIDTPEDYWNIRSLVDALGEIPHDWETIVENIEYVSGGGWQEYGW